MGKDTTWANNNLNESQLRFDGWFFVTPEQAGHWKIRQKFDDCFAFRIDGIWVVANNSYLVEKSVDTTVTEGWHRFTVVCGDTWGGQGGILSPGNVPMLISIEGGSEIQFTSANFTMGSAQPETLRLDADCDWTALGEITLNDAAVLDLNGHNLKVAGLSAGGYLGAKVVNNSETLSTLTVTNATGTTTLDGVAVQGNVAVVKQGEGAMRATPGSTYTGGLVVDEGLVTCGGNNSPLGSLTTNGGVTVYTNAVLELNGRYDITGYPITLVGGELKNSGGDVGNGTAQLKTVKLEADSKWTIATSYGLIGPGHSATTLDLGGNTLTVPLTSGKTFWLHNADVINGLVDITSGGWLKVDKTSCRASTADFRINCAMNVQVPMDVRDYIAVYGSNYNDGTGVVNVHGRFVPSETHNYFRGCVMQNGSTIDLGARTTALNAKSSFGSGANTLGFATGATVTVDISKRPGSTGGGVGQHHAGPLIPRQGLGAEGPAGAHDQVAGHPYLLRFVEDDLEHIDPFVAEPGQRLLSEGDLLLAGERDGIDLDAADARVLQQVQLAHEFFGLDLVPVPPPAHEGAVAIVRILELLVKGVRAREFGSQLRGGGGAQVLGAGRERGQDRRARHEHETVFDKLSSIHGLQVIIF